MFDFDSSSNHPVHKTRTIIMETFITRFIHITIQVFDQLDNQSLKNSREVSKSWKEYIDHKNLSLIRIVKIPGTLKKWETYLHLAAKSGQLSIFEMILKNEDIQNTIENRQSPFYVVNKVTLTGKNCIKNPAGPLN